MDVRVKNEESDNPVKVDEADVPIDRGEQDVQVKAEEEVSALTPPSPSQLRCALSVGASRISPRYQRSSSNLPMQQTTARPARLAVHSNASANAPSAVSANLMACQGQAHASLPAPSSASGSGTTTNLPPTRSSGVRQLATTKLQSFAVKTKSVSRHQPESRSGPNLILDFLAIPLSTPPSQSDQYIHGGRRPVSPMKTMKPMTGPVHPVAAPFCKETRARLDDKPHEDWIYTTSTGSIKKLPQLGSCGPWQVSLPSKMDTAIHIDPYIDRLSHLLNVQIESTKSPPSIHVKLFKSQLAEQAKHSYLLEEHTAMKWKAWAVLAAWVDHLVRRGAPPAIPPIDLVSFVRNKLLAEGRRARETAVDLLHDRQGVVLLPKGHGTLQMPRLTPADLIPLSKPSPPGTRKPSLMPTKRLPQASKYGHKHLLTDDSSSSSSSDSSPEVQAKRLRHRN
ncbi:uncharacterized protein GLRG_10954 [Colletotrichum graminicola M1.001]|uniref:Uncharacterized protein n=1 Tax=Colletotrichum graminicola (strain M1.001 / M2 / FGSC 10212) TaxID=645133 RepID=E3QYA7_COLGM|nr:uncharacterized protein GLRG_10954 [Colletotrichum graminicola M1.001]EFQ35845.1 hypothetical protein GLRG_10954 [Colletotrichum graminicola M1.001]